MYLRPILFEMCLLASNHISKIARIAHNRKVGNFKIYRKISVYPEDTNLIYCKVCMAFFAAGWGFLSMKRALI